MLAKCTFSDGDYLEFDEVYLDAVKAYVSEAVKVMVSEAVTKTIVEDNKVTLDAAIETVSLKTVDGKVIVKDKLLDITI